MRPETNFIISNRDLYGYFIVFGFCFPVENDNNVDGSQSGAETKMLIWELRKK